MTYDTTLLETLPPPQPTPGKKDDLPECLKRDRLNTGWFAQWTASQLGVVITLGVIFLLTSLNKLNHTDSWGHLCYGRWIAQHHALPAIDPFAATQSSVHFVPSAWLAQVLGYETIQTFGVEGLLLSHAVLATLACGLMIAAIRARGVPLCWAIAGGAAYYILSLPIVGTLRPQLFGMVGAAAVLFAAAQLPTKRLPLVWLPVLFLLWANLHGSFVMGLAMLGICAAGNTWRIFGEKRNLDATAKDLSSTRLWAGLGLAILGAAINPRGLVLFADVLGFGKSAALADISEWRSLTLASISGVLFFVTLIGAIPIFKLSTRRWELSDLLLLGVFALATFSAMRMLAWWAAVWPFAIMPYAVSLWESRFQREETPEGEPNAMRAVLGVGFAFMVLLMAPPSNQLILGRERGIGAVADDGTPIYIADEIQRRELKGRFFSPMDWADYFVWTRGDGFRPLAYSHVHMLSPEVWAGYRAIGAGDPKWLSLADEHQLRYLVVSKKTNNKLAGLALQYSNQKHSRATLLYQDQHSLLFELRPQAPANATAAK
jgi:hypothetical protein